MLLGLGEVICLIALPRALHDYMREPEDVWTLSFWLVFGIFLGTLCLSNAIFGTHVKEPLRNLLVVGNGAAILLLLLLYGIVLYFVGSNDPAGLSIVTVSIMVRSLWSWACYWKTDP